MDSFSKRIYERLTESASKIACRYSTYTLYDIAEGLKEKNRLAFISHLEDVLSSSGIPDETAYMEITTDNLLFKTYLGFPRNPFLKVLISFFDKNENLLRKLEIEHNIVIHDFRFNEFDIFSLANNQTPIKTDVFEFPERYSEDNVKYAINYACDFFKDFTNINVRITL